MVNPEIHDVTAIARACAASNPERGTDGLLAGLGRLWPDLAFKPVLTRGGWYRPGGVVDIDQQRIAESLRLWAERQAASGELQPLLDTCLQRQLFATRLDGRTHYLTAQTGPAAADFMQLEVEELQEVLDRYLSDPDWLPESLEEFIDPLDYPHLEPEPVGVPRLAFRRIFSARELSDSLHATSPGALPRFLQDWDRSSAAQAGHFCDHWVLGVREARDSEEETLLEVHPVPVGGIDRLSLAPGEGGAGLARRIHAHDREAGYPMAWFFHTAASATGTDGPALQVIEDHEHGFSYLPARDLDVVRGWAVSPYRV